jgi:4-alpha-glucanotransferase
MWVILPWQDWLSIDNKLRNKDIESERINVPANSEHYWNYRMHIPMEQLLSETELNNKIKKMCGSVSV